MFAATQDLEFMQGQSRDVSDCELVLNIYNMRDQVKCSITKVCIIMKEENLQLIHKIPSGFIRQTRYKIHFIYCLLSLFILVYIVVKVLSQKISDTKLNRTG